MADKKDDKKKPATGSSESGHEVVFKIFGLIFVLLMIAGILSRANLDWPFANDFAVNSGASNSSNTGPQIKNKTLFDTFPVGEIDLGSQIVNKREIQVRNQPAGQILGTQDRGEEGKVREGPVKEFDITWWRVDFKNAPDGWVDQNFVTTHVGWFNTIHFFPWAFNGFRVTLIILGVVALLLMILISFKKSELKKIQKKKQEMKKEIKQENIKPKKEEKNDSDPLPVANLPIGQAPKTENVSARRWKNILSLIHTHNSNDWKQAIIEADIILDEMLEKMGYQGNSIGDKLKQVEPSDFLTLNQAWEAHKVRNRIAHQGGNYVLSKDEAEKVIGLYEEVFKEFYYI